MPRDTDRKGPYPFHVWLALPHAEPAVQDRDADHRRSLVATAGLEAFGIARLVDVETRVKRIDGDNKVHGPQSRGNLAAQVDEPITGAAGQ